LHLAFRSKNKTDALLALDRSISRHGCNLLAQTGHYHIDTVKIEALHIAAGQRKRQFNPVRCLPTFPVQVLSIDQTGTRQLTLVELASRYGEVIAVREDDQHRLIPEQGIYRLLLQTENTVSVQPITVRGRLALSTPPESLAGRLVRSAVAISIRESGW